MYDLHNTGTAAFSTRQNVICGRQYTNLAADPTAQDGEVVEVEVVMVVVAASWLAYWSWPACHARP